MEECHTFTFGPFLLDGSRRVLECSGKPVALSSRGFDILRVLVEAHDRVVTRAEILAEVWAGRTVEEHNLSVQMSKLRRALGDDGERVITTIPGRGYRFTAQVEIVAVPPGISEEAAFVPAVPDIVLRPRLRPLLAAAVIALVAMAALWWNVGLNPPPPRLSIVVMPLRDLSDHPANQYLADAITDDLTTDLAHLPGSVVIARETADALAARPMSAPAIGRRLDVRYLLEGSLRVEDANLHLNVQLIDTERGDHLWSERFDIPRAGLADTRARIVGRIAGALDLALDGVEASRAARKSIADTDAVDLLFRARSTLDHDDTLPGFVAAESFLKRAVALEPGFVEAQAALGLALLHKIHSTDDPDAQADHAAAHDAVTRALALAPDDPGALTALAELQFADGHFTEADESAGVVLAANPNDVEARDVIAASAAARGDLAGSVAALQDIMRLNPEGRRSRIRALRLGTFLLLEGHVPDAERWLRRAIAGEPDPLPGAADWGYPEEARMLLVACADLEGRTGEAHALHAAYDRVWPHRTTWRIAALSTRSMSGLPGFARMLGALQEAGMRAHADEHVDDGFRAGTAMLPDNSFAPTPATLPGAATIDTQALAARLQAGHSGLVLDLGAGAAVIPGAVWEGPDADDDAAFVDAALRARPSLGHASPIVVMADGTYGSVSYNAAWRLVQAGYRDVAWYRGGEEAWAAARLPSADLRP